VRGLFPEASELAQPQCRPPKYRPTQVLAAEFARPSPLPGGHTNRMPVQRSTFSLRTEEVVIIGLNFSAKRCVSSARYDGMRAVYAASLEQKFAQSIPVDWEDPSLDVVKQTIMKKYCARIHGQPVLEAVLDLKRRSSFTADEIEHVGCDVFKPAFDFAGGVSSVRRTIQRSKSGATIISNTLSPLRCSTIKLGPPTWKIYEFRHRMLRRCSRASKFIPTSVSALVLLENSVPLLRFAAKTSVSLGRSSRATREG
jgi:hypothetical protein